MELHFESIKQLEDVFNNQDTMIKLNTTECKCGKYLEMQIDRVIVNIGGQKIELSECPIMVCQSCGHTALAPIPMSSFAGEPTSNIGRNFLRSYAGVCLEGAVIALACVIFSVMAASPPAIDPDVSVVTAVWSYVGELIFNLLVLVGAVRMSDRIVKELLGL